MRLRPLIALPLLCGACVSITGLGDLGVEETAPPQVDDGGNRTGEAGVTVADARREPVHDAAPVDAALEKDATEEPIPLTPVSFQCVPLAPQDESNPAILIDANIWSGFRFEVSAGSTVTTTSVGLRVQATGGTLFAAIVKLSGPNDEPDAADLSSADVLQKALITAPGNAGMSAAGFVSAPIAAQLAPGWYAVFFGSGAFGATASGAARFQSGAGGCTNGSGFPLSIRQSDKSFILQAATPHFVVNGLRP